MEFPDEQEGISDILVGRTSISVNHGMCDFCNSVYIGHNVSLQDFGCLRKMIDNAKSEDRSGFHSRHHWIYITTTGHILSYNTGTRLSKAKSKEVSNLDNRSLQDLCLVEIFVINLIICLLDKKLFNTCFLFL
jgi:hypothetical protein